jgi:hypothetical protein
MQYSSGGWLNFQSLNRRMNAFEKTVWADISSPVLSVQETLGERHPNTSQIAIRAAASSGIWWYGEEKVQNPKIIDFWVEVNVGGYVNHTRPWNEKIGA